MKAIEVSRHFLSRADWVDPAHTVDGIIVGDPEKEIRSVLVTWISSFVAVRTAVERGFDMLMTHEPTFWAHVNELGEHTKRPAGSPMRAAGDEKRAYIERGSLVILRNHDVWDRMPDIGIPWAWARFLGMGTKPAAVGAKGYQHRYDIEPVPLDALAQRIARRTAEIGERSVQVVGDGSRIVSKVGIGTGCGCDISVYRDMGCDVSVVCDDGSCYWAGIQCAADCGHPVIRVNHGTSEEPGMVTLTKYVNDNLEGVRGEHLPHGSMFRLVGRK